MLQSKMLPLSGAVPSSKALNVTHLTLNQCLKPLSNKGRGMSHYVSVTNKDVRGVIMLLLSGQICPSR